MIYLVDIDGTIADLTHRLHFIQSQPADWDGFFAACPDDEPIFNVMETVRALQFFGCDLFCVTGRSDAVRNQTIAWLSKFGIWPKELYMRTAGDHRQDNIVKSELLDKIISDYPDRKILGAFEDRNQVVEMYRQRGITVFQVADGNF